MGINFIALVVGFIWYNPKVFGTIWMKESGMAFRTFKHGALHGFMAGLFLALPVIGTNALYERRSFKYTLVTRGFWIVCFMIMGGIICAYT